MERPERRQHLFIVRLWREPPADNSHAVWRGSVEEPPTANRHYFASLADLSDFVVLLLGSADIDHSPIPNLSPSNLSQQDPK